MASEHTLEEMSLKLDTHKELITKQGKQLHDIQQTLQKLAVQDEQIGQIQREQKRLWEKMDGICGQNGALPRIERHQASCPRGQIQALWYVVIPMGLSQLALAVKLFEMVGIR